MAKKKEFHDVYVHIPNEGGRRAVFNFLIDLLQQEEFGSPSVVQTYRYFVDQLEDGSWIILVRPGKGHGGDFKVIFDNFSGLLSFDDLRTDLLQKYNENPDEYRNKLYPLMKRTFECAGDVKPEEWQGVNLHSGFTVEFVLKALKYLFIEQDRAYHHGAGRTMPWCEVVPDKNGILRDTKDYDKFSLPDGYYTLKAEATKKHQAIDATVMVSSGHYILQQGSVVAPVPVSKITKTALKKRDLIAMNANGEVNKTVDLGYCELTRLTEIIAGCKLDPWTNWRDDKNNIIKCYQPM